MITRFSKTNEPAGIGNDTKGAAGHADAAHDENCRCKETSQMSAQELIKLMMNDLAFWKKAKKG